MTATEMNPKKEEIIIKKMTTSLNKVTTIRVSWQTNRGFVQHSGNGDNEAILKGFQIIYNVQNRKKENHKTKVRLYEKEQEDQKNYLTEILEMKNVVIISFKSSKEQI